MAQEIGNMGKTKKSETVFFALVDDKVELWKTAEPARVFGAAGRR
jgi:hypothetical protein